jgi:hypothetical protein
VEFISSSNFLQIASPSPVPPYLRVVELSTCVNCLNIFCWSSVEIPILPGDIKKGMDAGFFRYITKPIRVNELIAIVSLALESIKEPMR